MKYIIIFLFSILALSSNAQNGFSRPEYTGWPIDSFSDLTFKWDKDLFKSVWKVDGIGNDSVEFLGDTLCITYLGNEYCVNLDSVFYTDSTLCWIILPDTNCIEWSTSSGNIYNMDGALTGVRTVGLGSNWLSFMNFNNSPSARLYGLISTSGDWAYFGGSGSSATQSQLAIGNSDFNTGSDAMMRFQTTGGSNRQYSLGVDRSGANFALAEENDLGADPYMQYYGGGDSLIFVNNKITSGSAVKIRSNTTGAASNTQKGLDVKINGTNGTSNQSTYAGYFTNTHAGTGSNNYGIFSTATGGLGSNYGVWGQTSGSAGYGVFGNATGGVGTVGSATSGYGVQALATTGIGLYASGTIPIQAQRQTNSPASTPMKMIELYSVCSSVEAPGFGPQIVFKSTVGASLATDIAYIEAVWSDTTTASLKSKIDFKTYNGSTGNALTLEGNKRVILYGRLEETQGADVASASTLTLGYDGNTFEITGTTSVTLISSVGWQSGSTITLIFTSTPTITDGTANSGTDIGIELDGNASFGATADDLLTLKLCEIGGVQRWRELSRSAN